MINMTISVARIGIGRTGQTNTEEHRLDRNAISVGLRGEIHAEEHNNAISVGKTVAVARNERLSLEHGTKSKSPSMIFSPGRRR
mgnify:CR=1 FL=1